MKWACGGLVEGGDERGEDVWKPQSSTPNIANPREEETKESMVGCSARLRGKDGALSEIREWFRLGVQVLMGGDRG